MTSFLDPPVLFFIFGILAGWVKSNLEIPPQIARFLALYLLMALGLKGGFALAESGFTAEVSANLITALSLAIIVPVLGYVVMRRFVSGFDAAAIAATYGSVSAVTFITAVQHLDTQAIDYGGHMAAALALMESPAIIFAVLLANWVRARAHPGQNIFSVGRVLHESFTDGGQLLLLGAMVIGLITGATGQAAMQPFAGDLFKGMLAFFLIDMGLVAARNMRELRGRSPWLLTYAIVGPLVHAALALTLAQLTNMQPGNAVLLVVLAASASYIAVPAVIRHAIPEASPSLYLGMSLGITFPFNIVLGIPLYTWVTLRVLG
jgi:hypothetical protein